MPLLRSPSGRVGHTAKIFNNTEKTAIATEKEAWRVVLDPMEAVALSSVNEQSRVVTRTITCEKDGSMAVKEIANLVVGEVWISSDVEYFATSKSPWDLFFDNSPCRKPMHATGIAKYA
jgi:hypothetical protein